MPRNFEAFKGGYPAADRGDRTPGSVKPTEAWPVESVFMTTDSRRPDRVIGFGTWATIGTTTVGTTTVYYWVRTA